MEKQTLFSILFLVMSVVSLTACSSSDDVQVTEAGQNNSKMFGKWEFVEKVELDIDGKIVKEISASSLNIPAQTVDYYKGGISIQTDYVNKKDGQGNYYNKRSPRQWMLSGTRLYLGISKTLEQNAEQIYDVQVLNQNELIIERKIDANDGNRYTSNVSSIKITYKKVN
ncbi:hypothetical protein [Myroides profundi]|uniref:Lipocalin-like domain-containing protein n=1 Tax=Myroides profundi TaxID=480520 RepID=A0AAJ4W240_MYRPR|nr:hypothetical protein [Myroides profundi]AJH14695.1 hypothetical protein MPR_1513 [Myroides profundi]SEQ18684.1 hypothetical protein SAMN04488089_1028 [Myroides profundi]